MTLFWNSPHISRELKAKCTTIRQISHISRQEGPHTHVGQSEQANVFHPSHSDPPLFPRAQGAIVAHQKAPCGRVSFNSPAPRVAYAPASLPSSFGMWARAVPLRSPPLPLISAHIIASVGPDVPLAGPTSVNISSISSNRRMPRVHLQSH